MRFVLYMNTKEKLLVARELKLIGKSLFISNIMIGGDSNIIQALRDSKKKFPRCAIVIQDFNDSKNGFPRCSKISRCSKLVKISKMPTNYFLRCRQTY